MAKRESRREAFYRLHDEIVALAALTQTFVELDRDRGTPWVAVLVEAVRRLDGTAALVEHRLGGAK